MKRSHLLAAASAAGILSPLQPARADATSVHIGSALEDTVRPLLWGINAGVFRKLGLTIDVEGMGSGAATTAAVVGGALDIGHSSLLTIFSAHLHGVPIKLVAQGWNFIKADPRGGLLVKRDSTYRTGSDFNGKTFAASAIGDLKSLIIRAWVDQHGGDSKSLKFVELPSSAEVPALQAGRVDGIVAYDPWIDMALASGTIRQVTDPGDAIANRYLVTGWIARNEYIAANPDTVRKFYAGMRTSSVYANGHDKEMAAVLAPFFHRSFADIAKSRHLPLATSLDVRDIQPVIDVCYKYGALPRTFPAAELIADVIR